VIYGEKSLVPPQAVGSTVWLYYSQSIVYQCLFFFSWP